MNYEQLKILGLNSYEAKVYVSLLHIGEAKASRLIDESKVPSGKIYETLQNLEDKGLVQTIPEKIKIYVPRPIDVLLDKIKEQKEFLNQLHEEVKDLKKIEEKRTDEGIFVLKGKKNFHNFVKNSPRPKTFSYAIKWSADIVDMNIQKNVKESKKNKIISKVLYDFGVDKKNVEYWKTLTPNYEYIKSNKVAMSINDSGVLISSVNLNSSIYIKSKDVVEVMKQLFEGYWESKK